MGNENPDQLIEELASKALSECGGFSSDLERLCWMIVHEYHHGTLPFEYDVRDIDEDLYLKVLNYAKTKILESQNDDNKLNNS